MNIGKIVSECLNNPLIQHYFMKKREMTYDEKDLQIRNFSRMIGYCILFKESERIEEYMRLSDEEQQIRFLKEKIADKLQIPHNEINEKIEDIIRYAADSFIRNGYFFHGGNSSEMEHDMKYGLNNIQYTNEDKDEILHINSIISKYESVTPFFLGPYDIETKKEGWFYEGSTKNMLYYSNSPEWFRHFCGEAMCYDGLVPIENRHGYENRDYDACFLTISKLIEKYNMSEEDKKEIIAFFNKCWEKFGNTNPCLLFVPISTLENKESLDYLVEFYLPSNSKNRGFYDENQIFKNIIICDTMVGFNESCDKSIPKEYLSYVDLSPILPRFKVSEASKQREMTIHDCIRKLNGLNMQDLLKAQELLDMFPSKSVGKGL